MKKLLMGMLIIIASLFLLSAPCTFAQDACEGDLDCDQDVDGTDAGVFKEDFGRNLINNPCPACNPCPYDMVDCGTKCVDPMTDEGFCGVDLSCLGGTVCGATEKCISGICEMIEEIFYQAAVPRTGQALCYDRYGVEIPCTGTGQDGEYQYGIEWPNPRFTDNGNGTVTDNLTGLIWLKNADCFGERIWSQALSDCNELANGQCGLTDGSNSGDWRLPNSNEINSLVSYSDFSCDGNLLSCGHPFIITFRRCFWTSTTWAEVSNYAFFRYIDYGSFFKETKNTDDVSVWCVRGGL
jgi:hypothetical protein